MDEPGGSGGGFVARVSRRGAVRWTERLHPWIYRSDVVDAPGQQAGAVDVVDERGQPFGSALWSPVSTIALRMLTHEPRAIDAAFWRERIHEAVAYRAELNPDADAYRIVHAEADGVPSLIVDRYADWLVVEFLSAGIELYRDEICDTLIELLQPWVDAGLDYTIVFFADGGHTTEGMELFAREVMPAFS